jgi:hypothetical protein
LNPCGQIEGEKEDGDEGEGDECDGRKVERELS